MTGAIGTQPVWFNFRDCDITVVVNSVVAAVDHLCSVTDVDIALLESLEMPVGECLASLAPYGIEAVEVHMGDGELALTVDIGDALPIGDDEWLGASSELVCSYFEVDISENRARASLVGSLR